MTQLASESARGRGGRPVALWAGSELLVCRGGWCTYACHDFPSPARVMWVELWSRSALVPCAAWRHATQPVESVSTRTLTELADRWVAEPWASSDQPSPGRPWRTRTTEDRGRRVVVGTRVRRRPPT
jgi:hypothetical protein